MRPDIEPACVLPLRWRVDTRFVGWYLKQIDKPSWWKRVLCRVKVRHAS